jgi:MinD superfamily P-loop ATPase
MTVLMQVQLIPLKFLCAGCHMCTSRCQVFVAVSIKVAVFGSTMPCSLIVMSAAEEHAACCFRLGGG